MLVGSPLLCFYIVVLFLDTTVNERLVSFGLGDEILEVGVNGARSTTDRKLRLLCVLLWIETPLSLCIEHA